MTTGGGPRVLVAGVGNIFLGDDGFGVSVAGELTRRPWPDGVVVADFGIRGVHLAYELLDGYSGLVLVDACDRGDEAGTLEVFEPDVESPGGSGPAMDAHSLDPASVLRTLAGIGGHLDVVRVVSCQPASLDEGIGLSEPVAAAVPAAAELVAGVVDELLSAAGAPGRSATGTGSSTITNSKENPVTC